MHFNPSHSVTAPEGHGKGFPNPFGRFAPSLVAFESAFLGKG